MFASRFFPKIGAEAVVVPADHIVSRGRFAAIETTANFSSIETTGKIK
jgi:hypothetical protein